MYKRESSDQITDVSALLDHPDAYRISNEELQALQLRLLQKLFAENRNRIPVLQRAADHKGIYTISQLQDAVALLFSHATYKSYPESFLDKGQWDKMNQWASTLSARGEELRRIDVSHVSGLDSWLALLDQHGFAFCHSSGSSGKPSFIPKSMSEQTIMGRAYCAAFKLGQGVDPHTDKMPVFCVTFRSGWSSIIRRNHELAQSYSISPTAIEFAFNGTQSPAAIRYEQKMKKLSAEGRVAPGELAAFQEYSKAKQAASEQAFQDFVQRTVAYEGQRIMILGHTATVFQLATKGREMGLEGLFAPGSLVIHGGGKKGAALPENYEDLMAQYFGVPRKNVVELYGMTERNSTPLVCEYGRKHCSPWEIPLLLDREDQRLLNVEFGNGGIVTGRYGFVDLLASSYWGGFTTGDRVSVSFDRCPCGRQGPQFLEITRYTDLPDAPDEDKLSCAAEMTSYVFTELDAH